MEYSGRRLTHVSLVFCLTLLHAPMALSAITIANAGTDDPTLLYQGRPMLKIGPLPEVAVFATQWGSRDFPHQEWLDWMQENRLGYGRVYPESAWPGVPNDADQRVFPFDVVRWEEGRPIVDLTRFNAEYWDNFARIIGECADRDIVLHIQLYQRCFFQTGVPYGLGGWDTNYFHPRNNVNDYPVPEGQGGYGLWKAMAESEPWKAIHRRWVEHVLDAIGARGNVMIDLMNEGAFVNDLTEAWIEYTLDIIEQSEQRNDVDILVGMDFDHFYKKNDPGLENILAHPRMELLICEGSEGHVARELVAGTRRMPREAVALKFRRQYRKPMISANSPGRPTGEAFHEGYHLFDAVDDLRIYQWYCMMVKVQGVGVYAKTYPLDFGDERILRYARESRILMDFFDTLGDYAALRPEAARISKGPGVHRVNLASSKEAVIYLHMGKAGETCAAGESLVVEELPMATGQVSVRFLHPRSGEQTQQNEKIQDGRLAVSLPAFTEDLTIHATMSQNHRSVR